MRERLFKLGFTASCLKELDSDKAYKFILIANEFEKIKREQEQRAMKKGKR